MIIKDFVKRHPVLTYFALAFAISWIGILIIVGPGGILDTAEQVDTMSSLFLLVMVAWLAGPSVAGILLTGLVYGRAGFRDLFTRITNWRVGVHWYAVALLTAPLLYMTISLALSLTSPMFLPSILVTSDKTTLLLIGIAWGLIGGGFLEELGWTGFAVPRMRLRYGIFSTGLIVGLLWGAYHFNVVFWATDQSGTLSLALVLPVQLFAWLPPFRVLMVWVYDRTKSLLVAMLMHASLTASMLILQPMAMSGIPLVTFLLILAAALWIIVAAVAVTNGGHRLELTTRLA